MRHRFASLLVLALASTLASLPGCGKDETDNDNPTGPAPPSNTALHGVWVGSLIGPDVIQRSGWSTKCRDSVWLVLGENVTKYYMSPAAGADSSLALPPDTCFVRYASALSSISDPNVSFRVNFYAHRVGWESVPFVGVRNGTSLAGTMTLPGDSAAGSWALTLCPTCPDTAKRCR